MANMYIFSCPISNMRKSGNYLRHPVAASATAQWRARQTWPRPPVCLARLACTRDAISGTQSV